MIVMTDMSTGKIIEDEFGSFEDEVLNAEWQPPLPALELGLQDVSQERDSAAGFDIDHFMSAVYSSQE